MLSIRITLLVCLFSLSAMGQDLLFQESFESDNEGITYVSNSFESGCDFFDRFNSPPANGCFAETITGLEGSFMWTAKDVDAGVPQGLIDFEPIDVSSYISLTTRIKFAVTNDGNFFYPASQRIYIEYSLDDSPYQVCGLFTGNDPEFGNMALDIDLIDGTFGPFGSTLTDNLEDFIFTISGTGSQLRLRLRVLNSFNSSEFALDDVRIFGFLNEGCTNPIACNYNPAATIDDGSCTYLECLGCEVPVIYIPEIVGSGPAIYGCGYPPVGYIIPVQFCANQVALDDDYCLNVAWDFICQNAYELSCFGCAEAGCTDPLACNFDPTALCDDSSCILNDQYYIPIVPDTGPMLIACEAPAGYQLASRNCAMAIAELDPFCLVNSWDFVCQTQYINCLQGNYVAYGCTYENAQNFSAVASIDDGTCTFIGSACPGDLNGDLVINTGDLTGFLALFGTSCP